MNRKDRIRAAMIRFEEAGIISECFAYSTGSGTKWVFTPAGHSMRSLTTSQIEDFILGVETVQAAAHNAKEQR